jgi:FkbM family methyltransferase
MSHLTRSLSYRWKRYRLGVWSPWRSLPTGSVTINGQYRRLQFPPGEEQVQLHELSLILVDDCYRLAEIDSPVNVVVDVGGNIGLFTLAALNRFQPKHIHTYEPNPQIQSVLEHNTEDDCVTVYPEAIGVDAGTLELALHHNSLHTTSVADFARGRIYTPVISMREVVERAGGQIDLLKLDCEGAEWELLDDPSLWSGVQHLTMEYHLWAKPGSTVDGLKRQLNELGFHIRSVDEQSDEFGLLFASREKV